MNSFRVFKKFKSSSDYLSIVGGSASGSAYIFRRDDSSWVEEQKILASDGAPSDLFGWSVSISGDYAIVGVPNDDDNGSGLGSHISSEEMTQFGWKSKR